jgi:hypothetical protein
MLPLDQIVKNVGGYIKWKFLDHNPFFAMDLDIQRNDVGKKYIPSWEQLLIIWR